MKEPGLKELLQYFYEQGKYFGYALARDAKDLPTVRSFDDVYADYINNPFLESQRGRIESSMLKTPDKND